MRLRNFMVVLFFCTGCAFTVAQQITFSARTDRSSIAVGEYVKLTVSLSNARENFAPPSFGGLVVVQGPFDNSSLININGRISGTVSRTWVLTATAPGKYVIGSAKVRVGGGSIATDPITIEVTKATTRPSDPYATRGQSRDPNLFITIASNKNKAYVGEQVVVTYTLYSRYANLETSNYDMPQLDGFWADNVDIGDPKWEDQLKQVNGLQYRVAEIKRQVLIPQRAGQLRIAPFAMQCIVNRTLFNRGAVFDVKSNAVEINVASLPPNPPPSFKGAVGELSMVVKVDRTTVQANEAIEVAVTYSGRGNLKLLDAPALNFPNDFETYDPKVTDRITVNASGMSGSRSYEYLVIPRHEGEYPLEPISFSYFDPRTGAYRTIQGEPLTIVVSPSDGGPTAAVQRPSKSDVELLGSDIRYIRTGDLLLRERDSHLFGSAPWIAGMAAPVLGFVLFVGWRKRRDAAARDIAGTRRRKADSLARKRLDEAAAALKGSDRATFYNTLSKALNGYLADKFGLGPAELTRESILSRFAGNEGGGELAAAYERLMQECEMARFAPVEERPREQLYDDAVALIARTEQLMRA